LGSNHRKPSAASPPKQRPKTSGDVIGGATTINYKLQEQVLREVFAPTRRRTKSREPRTRKEIPTTPTSPTPSNIIPPKERKPSPIQTFPRLKKKTEDEAGGEGLTRASASSLDLRKVATSVQSSPRKDDTADPETTTSAREMSEKLRRRYSADNMRDPLSHSDSSDKHDDTSDHDDHLFPMDDAPPPPAVAVDRMEVRKSVVPTYAQARQNWAERCYEIERSKRSHNLNVGVEGTDLVIRNEDSGTTRTEWFLLIENLTKNMIRPCVLDLKMGTRQYGYLSPSYFTVALNTY
jgi:inositol-hexakisphosphate 5-kinase